MQLQFAEILMYQQKHYKVLRSELWDFCGSFLQISEQENHQEKLQTDGPKKKISFLSVFFFFQYNFIEHTHIQLTFTKDNLQQNENYNLKLTKKKPNTIKTLVVTKIKWEHNQLSKQNFIPYLKETKKTKHFVLNSFLPPVIQEIYFSRLILSRAMSAMYVSRFVNLAPVVEMLECAICQKNCYSADKYQENLLH